MPKWMVVMLALAVPLTVVLTPLACTPAQSPTQDPDASFPPMEGGSLDADDPPPETAAVPTCSLACRKLKTLGCPEAQRPDGGETCYRTCERLERGRYFTLLPACVARAATLEAVRACGTVRCAR